MLEPTIMRNQIAAIRKAKGIKQRELAAALDTDQGHVSRIENGHVDPTLSTAKNIADALGVPVSEVFDFTESSPAA